MLLYDSGLLKTKNNYINTSETTANRVNKYTLTYHADGNIATVTDKDDVTSYVYDTAGRLTSESIDNVVQASYTYDAFGNRATKTESISTTTYTYDKNNRLTNENMQSDYGPSNIAYAYDSNGNLLSKSGSSTGAYAFDLLGRMASSAVNGVTSTYTSDGNGIRTSKTVGGVTTNFINDGAYVVGEASGDSIIKYTYGNGLVSINNNGTIGYYHTDEHGNVSAISNKSREVVATYDFDAFGNETASTDTYYNPMRYCGEYYDDETGFIYLRARYYSPNVGRFISEDPIKDGTNWYVYCSNNPIAFVDPSGEDAIYITDGDALMGVGHSSVVMQDEFGEWWYCYWGMGEAVYTHVPQEYIYSLDTLNSYLNTLDDVDPDNEATYDGVYTSYVYVQGNFTEGLDWLKEEIDNAGTMGNNNSNSNYNLFYYNCTITSTIALTMGTLPNGVKYGNYITSNYMIPNQQLALLITTGVSAFPYVRYGFLND